MSELSIVLDLRLLGKMWHGTREEQTPQPVRMTLGNKGAIHLPSPCFQWSFRLAFTVVLWCIHGLSLEIQPTWNQCCCHSWFCYFFGHFCASELYGPQVSPLCQVKLEKVNEILLNVWIVKAKWRSTFCQCLCVFLTPSGVAQWQLCDSVVCCVECG